MTSRLTLQGTHAIVHHCSTCHAQAFLDCLVHEKRFDLAQAVFVLVADHFDLPAEERTLAHSRLRDHRELARAAGN